MKSDLNKSGKNRGENTQLKNNRPEKSKFWGPQVPLLWRAAAPGLQPLRLLRARNNAGRLGAAGFISVYLETRWLGPKRGFDVPQRYSMGFAYTNNWAKIIILGWAGSNPFFLKKIELKRLNPIFFKNRVESVQSKFVSPRSILINFFFRVEPAQHKFFFRVEPEKGGKKKKMVSIDSG